MEFKNTVGFSIGEDMFRFSQTVNDDMPKIIKDGFNAAKHQKLQKSKPDRYTLRWLQIRRSAYLRNIYFDKNISAEYISSIRASICPVTGITMTIATGMDTDGSVDRIDNLQGYAIGNICMMSVLANKAKGDLTPDEIKVIANENSDYNGLKNIHWKKLRYLLDIVEESQNGTERMFLANNDYVPGLPYHSTVLIQHMLTTGVRGRDDQGDASFLLMVWALLKSAGQRKSTLNMLGKLASRYKVGRGGPKADDLGYWQDPRNRRSLTRWWDSLTDSEKYALEERLTKMNILTSVIEGPTNNEYRQIGHLDQSSSEFDM